MVIEVVPEDKSSTLTSFLDPIRIIKMGSSADFLVYQSMYSLISFIVRG